MQDNPYFAKCIFFKKDLHSIKKIYSVIFIYLSIAECKTYSMSKLDIIKQNQITIQQLYQHDVSGTFFQKHLSADLSQWFSRSTHVQSPQVGNLIYLCQSSFKTVSSSIHGPILSE